MARIDPKLLIKKLNPICTKALEASVAACMQRTHYEVSVDQFLLSLLERPDADIPLIFRHFDVSAPKVVAAINRALEDLKTGNSGKPMWSPYLVELLEAASLAATVELGGTRIRSGALLLALVRNPSIAVLTDFTEELGKLKEDVLRGDFVKIVGESAENEGAAAGAPPGARAGAGGPGEALEQFTFDLTAKAKAGKVDPVIGRESEVRQVVDILMRRFQNNPLIVGEPGTGKTAIAEGFALRIASGDVPAVLANVTIRTLDVGLLHAGASVKGEFENRLKNVIREVTSANAAGKPIILFIDEAHTLIGTGGGAGDAANLLKPALARGELRTIAATTWAEYKKYIEKDPPFAQRFGLIKLEEPSVPVAIEMLRGTKDKFESHHKVRILDDAVRSAVALSNQYLSEQQLPRKAIGLLDTACARVAVGLNTTPGPVEDIRRRIIQLDTAIRAQERDLEAGHKVDLRDLEDLRAERARQQDAYHTLEARWKGERELAMDVMRLRDELSAATDGKPADAKAQEPKAADAKEGDAKVVPAEAKEPPRRPVEQIRADLESASRKLNEYVGRESPMVPLEVNGDVVAQVLGDWTGIPAGKMVRDQADAILHFEDRIGGHRIVGQDHAIREIGKRLRIASGKLQDPNLPLAVIFMVGPSGTGKTETALAVADLIFGGERFMTAINMTEYSQSMNVSRLIGSAPGLVGFGEGGVLTEAVRQRPYSVVLLDEMEKACLDVNLLFMQVFDKGSLNDSEGREASFKNTVIMLTSNEGSDMVMDMCADVPEDKRPGLEEMRKAIQPILEKRFTPAFVGRTTVIPYYPLSPATMRKIVDLKLKKIRERMMTNYKMVLEIDPKVSDLIAARCNTVTTGARLINLIINETVLPEIARNILEIMGGDKVYERMKLGVNGGGEFTYDFA